MYKSFFALLLFFTSFFAFSQPIAEFEKKQIDFGTVTEGTVCKYSFKFKNTGNKPLIIYKIDVTCGCTTPRWTSPIAPGDTSSVYVEFNTSFKQGYVAKGVNLTVNADDPEVNLLILANIIPDTLYKVKIDSLTFNPLKVIYQKSYFQVVIAIDKLSKKGFKGDTEQADRLVKYILRKQSAEFLGNIWYNSTSDKIEINTFSADYKNILVNTLSKNLSKKRKIRRLQKKANKFKGI